MRISGCFATCCDPFAKRCDPVVTATGTLPLHIWLSPAYPIGAFAYSHGLEGAVENGDVYDAASAQNWLAVLLENGAIKTDTVLAGLALTAGAEADITALADLNALALALAGGRERYLETSAQGTAFLAASTTSWPCDILARFRAAVPGPAAYPVAFGLVASGHGVPVLPALEAFALAFVAMLVSATVRLGPIGQTHGQRITAALLPAIKALAAQAEHASVEELGACAFRSDIAALKHETQYSRLFRS